MSEQTTQVVITQKEFRELTKTILGLPVSWVWRGYGLAIFLEIGELTLEKKKNRKDGKERVSYTGKYGVMIEWSWRVERPKSIYFGSWSTNRLINNRLNKLKDTIIESIEIEGRLPELIIKLSSGLWLNSFATAEGQPQWCLFLDRNQPSHIWLKSEYGKLIKEWQTVISSN